MLCILPDWNSLIKFIDVSITTYIVQYFLYQKIHSKYWAAYKRPLKSSTEISIHIRNWINSSIVFYPKSLQRLDIWFFQRRYNITVFEDKVIWYNKVKYLQFYVRSKALSLLINQSGIVIPSCHHISFYKALLFTHYDSTVIKKKLTWVLASMIVFNVFYMLITMWSHHSYKADPKLIQVLRIWNDTSSNSGVPCVTTQTKNTDYFY
jgi:hypothetical protein